MVQNVTEIVVSSSEEIKGAVAALIQAGGGTLKLAASDTPYDINLTSIGDVDAPVTITSLDPDNPAVIATTYLSRAKGLTLDNLAFETQQADGVQDIRILNSSDITISNSVMQGIADGFWEPGTGTTKGDDLMLVRDSSDVTITGNTVSGYFNGIGLLDNTGVTITGNDISGIQGDGIRGGGQTELVISGNYIHDFYGTLQSITHTDMIQLWGTYTKSPNSNVTISDNVLFSGDGVATQGIFIRNETFGGDAASSGYFTNFTITNNIVYNGAPNGIAVSDVDGLVLEGNSLIWDSDALAYSSAGSTGNSSAPWIVLNNLEDSSVTGNIAGKLSNSDGSAGLVSGSNYVISYGDGNALNDNYAGNQFLIGDQGVVSPVDLLVDPDSALSGSYGAAPAMPWLAEENGWVLGMDVDVWDDADLAVTLTARVYDESGALVDLGDATVSWTFSDGTTLTGSEVTYLFDSAGDKNVTMAVIDSSGAEVATSRDITVKDPVLFSLNFDDNVIDQGSRGTSATLTDPEGIAYVGSVDGSAFHLTDGTAVSVAGSQSYLHDLDRFQIDLDLRTDNPADTGTVLEMYGAFRLSMTQNGGLSFTLRTDAGYYTLQTSGTVLLDQDWHAISVSYDDSVGLLQLYSDGSLLTQTEAHGSTTSSTSGSFLVGSFTQTTADTVIDNLVFSEPDSAAAKAELGTLEDTGQDQAVATPDKADIFLFDFEFEDGVTDSSSYATTATIDGKSSGALISDGLDGSAFHMDADTRLALDRFTSQIKDLDNFDLGLSVRKDAADGSGVLVEAYKSFDLKVLDSGALVLQLTSSDGTSIKITSDAGAISDTDWHDVDVSFKDGTVALTLDDAVVGEADVSGHALDLTYWGLGLGAAWSGNLNSTVDNFHMTTSIDSFS